MLLICCFFLLWVYFILSIVFFLYIYISIYYIFKIIKIDLKHVLFLYFERVFIRFYSIYFRVLFVIKWLFCIVWDLYWKHNWIIKKKKYKKLINILNNSIIIFSFDAHGEDWYDLIFWEMFLKILHRNLNIIESCHLDSWHVSDSKNWNLWSKKLLQKQIGVT